MPDPAFIFAQALSGLTAAMFLFLIASGLSLIFGVLRVLNFAHGSFYMLGAYSTYQFVVWLGPGPGTFWVAALGAALAIALLGGLVERLLFNRLYATEELYQLLFTYAPPLQILFDNEAIPLWVWPRLFLGGLIFFLVVEAEKMIIRSSASLRSAVTAVEAGA